MIKSDIFIFRNAAVAEAGLDRLACGLGGKAILPTIVSSIPQMLQNCKF